MVVHAHNHSRRRAVSIRPARATPPVQGSLGLHRTLSQKRPGQERLGLGEPGGQGRGDSLLHADWNLDLQISTQHWAAFLQFQHSESRGKEAQDQWARDTSPIDKIGIY